MHYTREMLQAFYKQWVVGNNRGIAVVGDVKAEEVLAMVTKAFAAMPVGTLALSSVPAAMPLTALLHEQPTLPKKQSHY